MNCKETQEVIHGYLDGELDVVHNRSVEQHLEVCAACGRSFQEQQSLRKVMARGSLYFEAPKGLEKRLRSAVRQANKAESSRWSWRWDWTRMLAPLAAAAVVLLIAMPLVMRTSTEDRLSQEIVSSHVRSLMASHLTDVASTDQHTVKPWFNGKLPFSPPVTDLAAQSFPLVGGRLDYVGNHPVADTISCDTRSSAEVRITRGMAIKRTTAAAPNEPSTRGQSQVQRHDQRGDSALLAWRTAERTRCPNPFGASK
jgi:anti-sigma factor RsiW